MAQSADSVGRVLWPQFYPPTKNATGFLSKSVNMTQRAFARREGINLFTFATWLRKKRLAAAAKPAKRPRFLEIGLRPAPPAPSRNRSDQKRLAPRKLGRKLGH
jgi:hypothetical protein